MMEHRSRLEKLLLDAGLITLPTTTDEDLVALGFDSLALVLFVVAAEKEFHVRIDPQFATIENFENLNQIDALLQRLGAR